MIKFAPSTTLLLAAFAGVVPIFAGLIVSRAEAANQKGLIASPFEPGEDLPGGTATSQESAANRDAFSHFSHGIGLEGESRFKIGNAIFRRFWVAAPASTKSADGLGPLFNARGCQNCHFKDGRGQPPAANGPADDAVSMFLRISIPPETDEQKELLRSHRANVIPDPVYGDQIQNNAIRSLDAEGHMHIDYEDVPVELAGGQIVSLHRPAYSVTGLAFGPLHPKAMLSPRVAPPMIGLGLLEAIPEAAIRANADPADANHDGISGRTNEVWSMAHSQVMLGRFGWKAGMPTVLDQSAAAAAGDIGLSSSLVPKPSGDCTPAEVRCMSTPNGNSDHSGGYEIGDELMALVSFYTQNLAVPSRRKPKDTEVLFGKALFKSSGCAACHIPSYTTGTVTGQAHLSNQRIWPYTDLLLHDMGEGLADGRPEGEADGHEWRTAPLWGVGLTAIVSGHTFLLHDGRTRNVEEAILWHGGEAQPARDAYAKLTKSERQALLAFVNSL